MAKNNIKRILAALLCAASILTCFSACGESTDGTENTDTNQTEGPADSTDKGNTSDSSDTVDGYTVVKNGLTTPGAYYQNPLTGSAADPVILKAGNTYYLYSTGDKILQVRTSTDLITWSEKKTIFQLSNTPWGVDRCWAPEVHEYNGKYYLFFCGRDSKQIFHGSVAVCDTPDGTFRPVTDQPLLNFSYSVIDLSFFLDDDGKTYIIYSKDCSTNKINGKKVSQSYGVEVSNDFTRMLCEPVLLSTPTESWETESGGTIWNEGPVLFKENGKYYLLYSANYYQNSNYSVGYATSDTVLAFYDKPKNGCILKGNGDTITGSGHCNILRFEDEIYLVYHSHTVPPNTDNGRSLYIDKLVVKEDGTLYANGPTNTKQPFPDGVKGYYKYKGDVTITGNVSKAGQDLNILFDEMTPKGFAGLVTFADGDSVTFKFPEGQDFDLMWVYSANVMSYQTASMDIIINNKYIYNDIKFVLLGSSPMVNFSKLPEGTLIEEITFKFTKAEGAECSAIGEIIFTTKKD